MMFSDLLIDDVSEKFVFTFVLIAPLGYAVHDTVYSPFHVYIAQQSYLSSRFIKFYTFLFYMLKTPLFLSQTTTNHACHQFVNCTDGPAKITTDPCGRFFVDFPIFLRVRKMGGKNYTRFDNLRTFL